MGVKLSYVSDIPEPDGYIPPKIALPMRLRILVCSIYWKGHWFNFHFRINTTIPLCSTIEVPTNTRLTSDASMLDVTCKVMMKSFPIQCCIQITSCHAMSPMTSQCLVELLVRWRLGHFHLVSGDISSHSITSVVSLCLDLNVSVVYVDIKISRIKYLFYFI